MKTTSTVPSRSWNAFCRTALAAATLTAWMASSQAAYALDTCRGIYSGSSLAPMPAPNVVSFQPANGTGQASDLGLQFVAGLQAVGVATTGNPTTQLDLSVTLTPSSSAVAAQAPGSYYGFGWAEDTSSSGSSIKSSTLHLSGSLTAVQAATMVWVVDITCSVLVDDRSRLAESLGELVGRAMGRNFDSTGF